MDAAKGCDGSSRKMSGVFCVMCGLFCVFSPCGSCVSCCWKERVTACEKTHLLNPCLTRCPERRLAWLQLRD